MPERLNPSVLRALKEIDASTRGDTATGIAGALRISRDEAQARLDKLRRDGFVRSGEGCGVYVSTSKGKEIVGSADRYW